MKLLLHLVLAISLSNGSSLVDLQMKDLVRIYPPVPQFILEHMLQSLNSYPPQKKGSVCKQLNSTIFWGNDSWNAPKMNDRATANCAEWVKNHLNVKRKINKAFAEVPKKTSTSPQKAAQLKSLWWKIYRGKDADFTAAWDEFFEKYESLLPSSHNSQAIRRTLQDARFEELKTSKLIPWWAWEDIKPIEL